MSAPVRKKILDDFKQDVLQRLKDRNLAPDELVSSAFKDQADFEEAFLAFRPVTGTRKEDPDVYNGMVDESLMENSEDAIGTDEVPDHPLEDVNNVAEGAVDTEADLDHPLEDVDTWGDSQEMPEDDEAYDFVAIREASGDYCSQVEGFDVDGKEGGSTNNVDGILTLRGSGDSSPPVEDVDDEGTVGGNANSQGQDGSPRGTSPSAYSSQVL